jgi:signal transduction histidine kinase
MKFTSIHHKLIMLVTNILVGAAAAFLITQLTITLFSIFQDARKTETTIFNALLDKGSIITANNVIAIDSLAVMNSFASIRDLVSAAVREDRDIVYGIYMNAKRLPFVTATEANPTGEVEKVEPLKDSMSLWADTLKAISSKKCILSTGEVIEFAAPAIADEIRMGTIRYGLSTKSAKNIIAGAKRAIYLKIPLYATLFIGIILITFILSMKRARYQAESITKPLEQLTQAVTVIAQGTYNVPLDLPPTNDEVGALSGAFESMRTTIQRYTEHLECMVAQRTVQLNQALSELKRSNTDLEQFAYVASHDLQEPLRKINSFSELLELNFNTVLGHQGQDYLQRMRKTATRMQELINGLLLYSRVTTKAQPFVAVDLAEITREVLSDLETRIKETQGTVNLGALPAIEADPLQMRQLMQNMIGNALKYHRKGAPPVVEVFADVNDGWCSISFRDNGIGFDNKYAEQIFGVFQRLHASNSDYQGSGVGLSVCRKIVERHNGTVVANGVPDQGATFTVRLPLRQATIERNIVTESPESA